MTEYNFFAIQRFPRAIVSDRWRLEADSFEEACEYAQSLEYADAEENEREPVVYEDFEELA